MGTTDAGASSESRSDQEKKKKRTLLLEVVGSVAAAAIGIYVYKATGLYSAADSGIVHVILGGAIVMWLILNVRIGLHLKKLKK